MLVVLVVRQGSFEELKKPGFLENPGFWATRGDRNRFAGLLVIK